MGNVYKMDIFVYKEDLFCENCALEIVEDFESHGIDDTGDSDDFPQGPYSNGGGGSFLPQYCGNCSMFLENPLTPEGYEALICDPDFYQDCLYFYEIYYPKDDESIDDI